MEKKKKNFFFYKTRSVAGLGPCPMTSPHLDYVTKTVSRLSDAGP